MIKRPLVFVIMSFILGIMFMKIKRTIFYPLVRFYIKLPFEAKKGDILRGGKED